MELKKWILAATMAFATATGAWAEDGAPLWIRSNAISPDGGKIAFSWQGDIFVVDACGGKALQVTSNPAYDSEPMWTPDGQKIVFSSYREGSKDIYITSCEGGAPKRLTDHPAAETPLCVTDDGIILYSADIELDTEFIGFPGDPQVYAVGLDGGRPWRVSSLPVASLSVNKDGVALYEDIKGYEDNWRKHHTSSVTRDVWLYQPQSQGVGPKYKIEAEGKFEKLSDYAGEDRNPVFAADGKTYYFLSEMNGSFNIYKAGIDSPGKAEQITFHEKHPVRYLSVAKDGTLAYSFNGELYTVKDGGQPEKVEIALAKDVNEKKTRSTTISSGTTAIAAAPDGKEIAIVARGDVFVASVDFNLTKRITDTPEQERHVCFAPDGRTLYFSAERNGHWGIYSVSLTEKEDKLFCLSYKTEEKLVSAPGETCFYPRVSPDGKWLAYLRDRTEIVIKNVKSGKEKSLLKDVNYSYSDGDTYFSWSPDSRYILTNYQGDGGWNNEDVAIIDIESGEIQNLTESGYTDAGMRWALNGKAMTFTSDKAGYRSHGSWGAERDVYLMFFDALAYRDFKRDKVDDDIAKALNSEKKTEKEEKKDSAKAEKKTEKLVLDLENRHDRTVRLTRFSGRLGDHYLTPDGEKLYYVARLETGYDLCVLNTKDRSIKVLKKGVNSSMFPSADGKYIYLLGPAGISRMDTATGSEKSIQFKGEYDYRPQQEREYIFEHVWKQVEDKFYDPDIHGVDWDFYKEEYAKFLPYIDNNYDFKELLSEMLGELNASHTGARYRPRPGVSMGTLGAVYDEEYDGDGLKIKEILKGGALDTGAPEVECGDIISAINGVEIKAGESWFKALTDKGGKKVMITVLKKGKKPVEIYLEPGTSDANALYKRWIKRNEEMVERLSGGKVGYVHVKGMDSDSFRETYSKLLGKYRSYEAVIVDTRHNGGGWLHDDLATLLSGKAYLRFEPRGQYIGTEPYSKWTKPSCVLVGEDNYSDACGFPYTYKTLEIGKLIGAPVPGTMTAVWWETLIDPTLIFGIPQVGAVGIKEGRYLENMQIEPDIEVYNDPASMLGGRDFQIEAAVQEMLREIAD